MANGGVSSASVPLRNLIALKPGVAGDKPPWGIANRCPIYRGCRNLGRLLVAIRINFPNNGRVDIGGLRLLSFLPRGIPKRQWSGKGNMSDRTSRNLRQRRRFQSGLVAEHGKRRMTRSWGPFLNPTTSPGIWWRLSDGGILAFGTSLRRSVNHHHLSGWSPGSTPRTSLLGRHLTQLP